MIYDNRPYDINLSTDLFGTFIKADSIKKMLDYNSNYFEQNNMVALYGEWGSGKTSVMEYIKKSICNYNVVFFEAWRYEKDSNLALSLFEMLLDKFDGENGIQEAIIENAKLSGRTLLNMGKNILLNSKVTLPGIEFEVGQAGKDTIEQMERAIERTSFYTNLKDFDDAYNKLLNKYFEVTDKKLLVFIDDLDRCAPENVLDLISGLKHFLLTLIKLFIFAVLINMQLAEL
ncbi:KAP family P-loop NTPase fold protein [Peribacillus frigoritolerans]|uniref:KAP family P-loop NTPase fold protein n=1 Tax=Peribacillus frigoritolerans TaxID=450367 RepID=UPI003F87F292